MTYLPPLQVLSRQIREGDASPTEIVERCLKRIDERDGDIQAWTYVARDEARSEAALLAEEIRTKGPRSPLHGIPFGVKDIYDTAGIPTEWGSPIYRGQIPRDDSELVAELRRRGAVVLGKTHTTAFAYYDPGPTRNPYHLEHTPGGSSSGSAAAVADSMSPFALGSQTQGSVLRPASFCGTVGFKPSFGKLARGGMLPFAPSLDHAGLFTGTVEDASFLWQALGNLIRAEPFAGTLAVVPWPPGGTLEPEMAAGIELCSERLRASGLVVVDLSAPESFLALPEATRTVMKFEAARLHAERFREHGARMGVQLARLIEEGLAIDEEEYRAALRQIEQCRADFWRAGAEHPVWLTPAAPGPAPHGLASTGDPCCNLPFTALGVPAVALPFGRSERGLPLGLQLAAPANREDLLLAAALACEKVLGPLPPP